MDVMAHSLVVSLYRHGLTSENKLGAYIGWTDVPLCEEGRADLHWNQQFILKKDVVFSSPLKRCMETAKIYYPNESIITLEGLKEIHFGHWEGKTYDELKNHSQYRKWLSNIFTEKIEGGESFSQFGQRIEESFRKITAYCIEKDMTRIAIITHGGVIRYLLHKLHPNKKSYFDWDIPYGKGYKLAWDVSTLKEDFLCTLLSVAPTMVRQIG